MFQTALEVTVLEMKLEAIATVEVGMTMVLSYPQKHRDNYGKLVMGTIFSTALVVHKTETSLLWWKRL